MWKGTVDFEDLGLFRKVFAEAPLSPIQRMTLRRLVQENVHWQCFDDDSSFESSIRLPFVFFDSIVARR